MLVVVVPHGPPSTARQHHAAAAPWSCTVQVRNWLPCRLQSASAQCWAGWALLGLVRVLQTSPSPVLWRGPSQGLAWHWLTQHHLRGRGAEGLGAFPISLRCCLTWHGCFPALMPPQLPMPTPKPPGFREEPSKPQALAPQGSAWRCWMAAGATCSRLLVY